MSALASPLTGSALGGPAGGDLTGTYPNPTFNQAKAHDWTALQTFEDGISADGTHVLTLPNSTTTLAGLGVAQTFTAAQTFTGGLTASAGTVSLTSPTMTSPTVSSGNLTVSAGTISVATTGASFQAFSATSANAAANVFQLFADGTTSWTAGMNGAGSHEFYLYNGGSEKLQLSTAGLLTVLGGITVSGGDLNVAGDYYANGTPGVASFGPAAVASITVKNGLIVAIS